MIFFPLQSDQVYYLKKSMSNNQQRSEAKVAKLNEEIANLKLESSKLEDLKGELEREKLKFKEIQKKLYVELRNVAIFEQEIFNLNLQISDLENRQQKQTESFQGKCDTQQLRIEFLTKELEKKKNKFKGQFAKRQKM